MAVLNVRREVDADGQQTNTGYWVWCPGCDHAHRLTEHLGDGPGWTWNGSVESPTFTPSLLYNVGGGHPGQPICHSFITDGQWQFLGDSTHALAGQTVPMVPLPDWLM